MEEAVRFFKTYEIWIYVLLALGGLLYIRKFILAWDELRGAAFGLERESAQSRLNQSAGMLFMLLAMAIGVFVVVSFVAPAIPASSPLLTPTLDLLATATTTLPAQELGVGGSGETMADETPVPSPTPIQQVGEGCIPDQILITQPKYGDPVAGIVPVVGTADIENFGFYKYEVARPGETVWLTIQAGREPKRESELGQWDTSTLAPGEYHLRLVVTDNEGNSMPPCTISVQVSGAMAP